MLIGFVLLQVLDCNEQYPVAMELKNNDMRTLLLPPPSLILAGLIDLGRTSNNGPGMTQTSTGMSPDASVAGMPRPSLLREAIRRFSSVMKRRPSATSAWLWTYWPPTRFISWANSPHHWC
jgi:hypothetical protein